MDKEAWLDLHGKPTCEESVLYHKPFDGGLVAVCLVNNGPFTAAAILFDEREKRDFSGPHDARPKQWYFVDVEEVKNVSNLECYIKD